MSIIRRLSDGLANQIAAGEVVERPASVVKELVENSLDAGATRVRVEIEQGGTMRIRVTDDGLGMDALDAKMCLERHATSKIAAIEDLLRLGTFGFRGEALPSVASVSKLTLVTRMKGSDEGTEVEVLGGSDARVKPAGCAVGTSIDVRELFFNVPARKKFLKSTATESAHVGDVVTTAALGRPDVTFVLLRDGRIARELLRVETRAERVAQVLGAEKFASGQAERGPLAIEAFLAPPERARAGAAGLHIFVNRRPVKDRMLARSVAQAYGSVLEAGRFPVGVLYLELPSEMVDVNVHPQKAEVRFSDARALCDTLTRELYELTSRAFAIPALGPPTRPWLPPGRPLETSREATAYQTPQQEVPLPRPLSDSSNSPPGTPALDLFEHRPRLRFVAQLRLTFLLCEGVDGIYVIDQHAAAERVTFDRLRKEFLAREIVMQKLLVPEVVELTAVEVRELEERHEEVLAMGLEVRAVGPNAVAVHAVPKMLHRASPERLLRDLVAELTREAHRPLSGAKDLVLATMACHGSVRAGDRLSSEEADALLTALHAVDFGGHCPHGRPVVTFMSFAELERKVGR